MRAWPPILWAILFALQASLNAESEPPPSISTRVFLAHGVIEDLKPEQQKVVIKHGAITNFMPAMTMPFKVRSRDELAGLQRGDEVTFQLHVTKTESWVDQFSKTGAVEPLVAGTNAVGVAPDSKYELLHYKFTNELGQAISLSDFPGQALAITFFYTRCPLPDYCPRLSRNFQEASQQLESMAGAPTNWHFLSISIDAEFDSPAMLQAYGQSYQYNPAHWSFLTGSAEKIDELARRSGVTVAADGVTLNHNFRTLIIDASGRLQKVFPTGGDLSAQIIAEIIQAAGATRPTDAQDH